MTSSADKVRMCGQNDRKKLLDFVQSGHDESAIFTLSENKVRRIIEDGVSGNKEHLVIIGVIDAPDRDMIAASIAIEYTQAWYSDDWGLYELWNNVHKDYRKTSYAQDLINFGKKISDQTNRPFAMSIFTTERVEQKVALYRRKMPQVGALFVYNLNKAHGPAVVRNVK